MGIPQRDRVISCSADCPTSEIFLAPVFTQFLHSKGFGMLPNIEHPLDHKLVNPSDRLKFFLNPFDHRYEDLLKGHTTLNILRDLMAGLIVALVAIPLPWALPLPRAFVPSRVLWEEPLRPLSELCSLGQSIKCTDQRPPSFLSSVKPFRNLEALFSSWPAFVPALSLWDSDFPIGAPGSFGSGFHCGRFHHRDWVCHRLFSNRTNSWTAYRLLWP